MEAAEGEGTDDIGMRLPNRRREARILEGKPPDAAYEN